MRTRDLNDIILCYPEGPIRNDTADLFDRELLSAMKEYGARDMILNLEGVTSISSNGLAVFIAAAKTLKEADRCLVVCGARDMVMRIFSILNIDSLIGVYETEEEALNALSPSAGAMK